MPTLPRQHPINFLLRGILPYKPKPCKNNKLICFFYSVAV